MRTKYQIVTYVSKLSMPKNRSLLKSIYFSISALWLCAPCFGAETGGIGTVKNVTGTVEIVRGAARTKVQVGDTLKLTDVVQTQSASAVGMTLQDNTLLAIGANSVLQMDKFQFDPRSQKGEIQATLKRGSLASISGTIAKTSPEAVQFRTPSITLGVRGTEFIIETAGEEQ